jgi:hypothetical protein
VRPAAWRQHFGQVGRGGRLILVLILLFVVGGIGTLGYLLIRPKEQYGKYGGIEIGNAGIKMFAADFFHDGNSWNYQTLVEDDKPVHLGDSLDAKGKAFAPDVLNDAMGIVKGFFNEMRKCGVPSSRIYVICSSGVFAKLENTGLEWDSKNQLRQEVRKTVDKEIEFLDATAKARYEFLACSPHPEDRVNWLLIHIGSGHTEGGCWSSNNVFIPMTLEDGYSKYRDDVNKIRQHTGGTFDEVARRSGKEDLIPRIRKGIESRKGLTERPKVFLLGGVVWAMTIYMHPDKLKEQRVRLKANDIKQFRDLVATNTPAAMRRRALATVDWEQNKALEQEIEKVQKVFKDPDKLVAGAEILAAFSAEYGFEGKDLESFRDANYACTIGHIAKTVGIEK